MLDSGFGRASGFFGRIARNKNAAQVVLPLFFGKADACLTTRASFKVMVELNPQLNTRLHVLAASPGLVPSLFAFRANYTSPYRAQILEAMDQFGESPAGRQILALIHADRVEVRPISCLDKSLELLARHRRLCRKNSIDPSGGAPGEVTESVE